jgi:non-ribosomal peptide synthetase component F
VGGSVTAVPVSSLVSLLRERASLQPDDIALTFTDYEQDWAGVAESLILAPQGLDYIAAFLGAMQAGFIAVPLPVPQIGSLDERVSAVLDDASPTVILTTSATVGSVAEYAAPRNGNAARAIVEVDLLDLDSGTGSGARILESPGIAYCSTPPARPVFRPV